MLAARVPYSHSPAPQQYDRGFLSSELQKIQRALAPSAIQHVVAAYTAESRDHIILCDATAGAFTVTLPPASQVFRMEVTVKKVDASANAITIGGTVDGAVNPTLAAQYKSITVVSDGTAWYKIASV